MISPCQELQGGGVDDFTLLLLLLFSIKITTK